MNSLVSVQFVCVSLAAVVGLAVSVPTSQQQQPQPRSDDATGSGGGLGTVLWSVLDDCFGGDDDDSAAVCLKTRALTALDRALGKPTVTVADGVSLAARAGKSLADPQADKADRAALDAAKDPEQKNALLDDMLASRMNRLMSTRTIVLDDVQEGEL